MTLSKIPGLPRFGGCHLYRSTAQPNKTDADSREEEEKEEEKVTATKSGIVEKDDAQ